MPICRGAVFLALFYVIGSAGCSKKKTPPRPESVTFTPPKAAAKGEPVDLDTFPIKPMDESLRKDWSQPGHIETLYKGMTERGFGISFAGVDAKKSQFIVLEGTGWCLDGKCGKPGFDVHTFDWKAQRRVGRWRSKKDLGCPGTWGRGFDDAAIVADGLRYSKLLASIGVDEAAAPDSPQFTTTADGKNVFFVLCSSGQGPNVIAVADDEGANIRGVGPIEQGKNTFSISPDAKQIAWHSSGGIPRGWHGEGPTGAPRVPGTLYLASVDQAVPNGDAVPRPRTLSFPTVSLGSPIWSRDGKRIYLDTDREEEKKSCLSWTDPATLSEPQEILCQDHGFGRFVEAKEAPIAILYDWDYRTTNVAVLELPSGKIKTTYAVPTDEKRFVLLHPKGNIIVTLGKDHSILVMDLTTGKLATLKPELGWYSGFELEPWLDDTHLALLNFGNDRFYQIVSVDIRGALADAPKPASDAGVTSRPGK